MKYGIVEEKNGTHLFIDTNVLLNFYAFSNDDLQELEKLIRILKTKVVKLYITQQAGWLAHLYAFCKGGNGELQVNRPHCKNGQILFPFRATTGTDGTDPNFTAAKLRECRVCAHISQQFFVCLVSSAVII